jgi:hypothetical protein
MISAIVGDFSPDTQKGKLKRLVERFVVHAGFVWRTLGICNQNEIFLHIASLSQSSI